MIIFNHPKFLVIIFIDMAKILDNIRVFAEKEGITIGALERKIGASKGVLSRAIANGTDIQAKWITAIVDNYPLVSAQWLLTGEGEMISGDSCDEKVDLTPECATNNITRARNDELPLHEHIEALAGIPSEDAAPSQYYSSYIVPDFKRQGATDLIRIHGNSMLPRYNSGDIVGVMQIFDPQFIEWGRVYVLDTTQGVLIKRLFPDKQNVGNYLCHSDNTEEYPDFSIPKTEIRKIFKVVGSIKLE